MLVMSLIKDGSAILDEDIAAIQSLLNPQMLPKLDEFWLRAKSITPEQVDSLIRSITTAVVVNLNIHITHINASAAHLLLSQAMNNTIHKQILFLRKEYLAFIAHHAMTNQDLNQVLALIESASIKHLVVEFQQLSYEQALILSDALSKACLRSLKLKLVDLAEDKTIRIILDKVSQNTDVQTINIHFKDFAFDHKIQLLKYLSQQPFLINGTMKAKVSQGTVLGQFSKLLGQSPTVNENKNSSATRKVAQLLLGFTSCLRSSEPLVEKGKKSIEYRSKSKPKNK